MSAPNFFNRSSKSEAPWQKIQRPFQSSQQKLPVDLPRPTGVSSIPKDDPDVGSSLRDYNYRVRLAKQKGQLELPIEPTFPYKQVPNSERHDWIRKNFIITKDGYAYYIGPELYKYGFPLKKGEKIKIVGIFYRIVMRNFLEDWNEAVEKMRLDWEKSLKNKDKPKRKRKRKLVPKPKTLPSTEDPSI